MFEITRVKSIRGTDSLVNGLTRLRDHRGVDKIVVHSAISQEAEWGIDQNSYDYCAKSRSEKRESYSENSQS